jgi:hypothetical protein
MLTMARILEYFLPQMQELHAMFGETWALYTLSMTSSSIQGDGA